MEYTFCNSFFAHSSGLRFAKKSKIYVLLIMLILILISARLWWARGELNQNCEIFGIFGRLSEHDFGQFTLYMISGSLRFINSEALYEKNPDLTNNLRKLIEMQYYSEDWYLILMLNKFHQSHCFNFCMCMIFLAVKIFISLFIKMKFVHFWNYMFKLTISIDGLYIHYACNNMPDNIYCLILRNKCY